MATSNQTFRGSLKAGTSPTTTHITLVASTEFTHALTGTVRKLEIQNPGPAPLRMSWIVTGTTTARYMEIPGCASREIDFIEYSGNIYLFTSVGQTVHVEQWV